ncbi:hypothetical protein SAMN05444397_11158 [Flavobacterium aquidurense]|uniref:G8 domain-containing protein n=1 Tax=Flavobacterium frigidimaris TaxID=262320 RepID=A0ABX4BNX7_FLAFR|nr:hypothetical protein [Flavobacterium frigidimaris]OXA78422.1 hypothetical protein B0A65_13435 [Flavobacterium frigidimaris]SDZ62921.1 hypothetical protein SAMN05444397_11158 [Flavobacterium aquidurense]
MKTKLLLLVFFTFTILINAQNTKGISGDTNWLNMWTNFNPKTTSYNDASIIITGTITSNMTLKKENVYLLVGTVYIAPNATLTIQPGTLVRCDATTLTTLVITKGAKIIAEGTETDPIVFTSNKGSGDRNAGDWGGIILLGDAPINKTGGIGTLDFELDPQKALYGGDNKDSDSGILKYVRIEFSGKKTSANKPINGLSLAGVGRKTKLEYIQVTSCDDDSFQFYGGYVNTNHLISLRSADDDFDFTQGVQCNISNSIAIRSPFLSDNYGSRCFEMETVDTRKGEVLDSKKEMTRVNAENMTMMHTEDIGSETEGLKHEAILIRENTFLTLTNSVVSGFSHLILFADTIPISNEYLNKITLKDLLINDTKIIGTTQNTNFNSLISNWYQTKQFAIEFIKLKNDELFSNASMRRKPDFRIKS